MTEQTFDAYSWQLIENKQKFISQIMTSKLPSRSCEDVDEAALSYAEVKALATGNPYMKEKLDLDVQVSRLNLLKANHQNQIYQLEDAIAKQYPAKCARLQEELTQVEADIARYREHRSESFQMELRGTVYTERKEAGVKLMELCKAVKQQGTADASWVGRYSGFELLVKADSWFSDQYLLTLQGVHTHTLELGADGLGNITRIQNVLEKLPERLAKKQEALRQTRGEWEQAKEECKKPFAQEEELREKTARLTELNVLLDVGEPEGRPSEQPKFEGAMQEDRFTAPAEAAEPVQRRDLAAPER